MPRQRILPHIMLGILAQSSTSMTGKQITDFVQREIGEFWQVAHSQVYPELKRMVGDGCLECRSIPNNEKERHYFLTEKGKAALEAWLCVPNDEIPQQKDIFSLKMFFIRQMDDERIPQLLEGQIELLTKHLQHLEERKDALFTDKKTIKEHYGHFLVIERAIARNKAQLAWLKDTLSQHI